MKKWKLISIIFILVITQTGCWDRREVNDVAFVLASSIDRKEGKYDVAVQIALPGQLGGAGSKGGGGGTSGGEPFLVLKASANTIREANEDQQKANSRIINFAHRRVVFLGENMARKGIEPIMDILGRIPQNRLTAYLVITKGPSTPFLEMSVPSENFSAEMVREMVIQFMKTPRSEKHALNIMLSDGIDLALPYVIKQEEGSPIKLGGMTVFKNNKLVGYLNAKESLGAMWAMGEVKNPEMTVKAPRGNGKIITQFQEDQTEIKPIINDDDITMQITIRAKGTVVENESNFNLSKENHMLELEKSIKKQMKKDILSTINKLQHEYNADVVGFGKIIYDRKPGEWNRLKDRWYEEYYPNMKVTVNADIRIENIGAVITPLGRKEEHIVGD